MAQFTVYKNTDGSAPTLNGTTDSLCALLRACLVDGYGSPIRDSHHDPDRHRNPLRWSDNESLELPKDFPALHGGITH